MKAGHTTWKIRIGKYNNFMIANLKILTGHYLGNLNCQKLTEQEKNWRDQWGWETLKKLSKIISQKGTRLGQFYICYKNFKEQKI